MNRGGFLCSTIFLTLVACTPTSNAPPKLKIGVNNRSSNAFICLIEKENARRGRKQKWQSSIVDRTEDAIEALADHKIDIAISAPPSFFRYAIKHPEKAKGLRIIAGINSIQNTFAVVARKKSGISEVKNMRQKRLGHTGEASDFFRTYFFLTEGVNETSFKQTIYSSDAALMAALEAGSIDAAIVPDEISRRVDLKIYNVFFSSVHEITSQVIVRKAFITENREDLVEFLENMISVEKELYMDLGQAMTKLKSCFPDSHDEILNDLLRRRELRVLIDDSLRAQYTLYKKWLMSRPEYRVSLTAIRGFNVQDYVDSSILRGLDFRRVLLK